MKNLTISGRNRTVSEVGNRGSNRQLVRSQQGSHAKLDYPEKGQYREEIQHVYKVDISIRSILLVVGTIAAIYLGYRLLQVAFVLFFAFVIASSLMPIIRGLINRGIPKWLSMFFVYFFTLLFIIAIVVLIVVPFAREVSGLFTETPLYVSHVSENLGYSLRSIGLEISNKEVHDAIVKFYNEQITGGLIFDISSIGSAFDTFSVLGTFFGGLFISFVLSIYIVYDHDNFLDLILMQIVHDKKRQLLKNLIIEVERKLGGWIVGQGTDSLIIAGLTWTLLTLLDVPFALPLALCAGLLVTIPTFGPFIAAIPTMIIGFISHGFGTMLIIALGYTIIQQIENTVIVPRIMGNVVGVKPIVVLVGLLISLSLGGIVVAVITVPLLVIGKIGYDFYLSFRRIEALE